jgi:antitoxin (DNA-binding transcriptional repressor) of toxin-antitoxin stability system
MCHIDVTQLTMHSLNLRQLRDTRRLKTWLREGKTVELKERDRVIAKIVPAEQPPNTPPSLPDFEARRKKVFGDRVFENMVLSERGRY